MPVPSGTAGLKMDGGRKDSVQTTILPPELIFVGVDIGMTFTVTLCGCLYAVSCSLMHVAAEGVAICSPDRMGPGEPITPSVIQNWPSSVTVTGPNRVVPTVISNKVPTAVAYRAGNFSPHSWGFACPYGNIGRAMCVKELFKFYLDEKYLKELFKDEPDDAPGTHEDVRKWYTDFLAALHEHIRACLEKTPWEVDWDSTKIEYIFSLPTSWKHNDGLIQEFENIVQGAGFVPGENCSVAIGLTEGEASAVYTAKYLGYKHQEGDVLLVCDAGGGTTDICVLQVEKVDGETVALELLDEPKAVGAGSIWIDEAIEKNIKESLEKLRLMHSELQIPDDAVHRMTRAATVQSIKLEFGTGASVSTWAIPVEGLTNNLVMRVKLSRDDIKAMFDEQRDIIFEAIDKELELLRENHPKLRVLYLVLAGGLGSSKYIQAETMNRYSDQKITVQFAKDPEPPLTVCKGLVLDRMQKKLHGTSVFSTRRARLSYGVLCDEVYDKAKHSGQNSFKNSLDGKRYARNQIVWFIWKGDVITENEPITHKCFRIFSPDAPDFKWKDKIFISRLSLDRLPRSLDHPGDAKVVSEIESDLGPDPGIASKRKHLFGKKYLRVDYELSISIKPEDLDFKTMINGAQKSESQTLKAHWIYTEDGQLSANGG